MVSIGNRRVGVGLERWGVLVLLWGVVGGEGDGEV